MGSTSKDPLLRGTHPSDDSYPTVDTFHGATFHSASLDVPKRERGDLEANSEQVWRDKKRKRSHRKTKCHGKEQGGRPCCYCCCGTRQRCMGWSVFVLVLLMGLVMAVILLWPQTPEVKVTGAFLTNGPASFKLQRTPPEFDVQLTLTMDIYNPNRIGANLHSANATGWYRQQRPMLPSRDVYIGQGSHGPQWFDRRSTTSVAVNLTLAYRFFRDALVIDSMLQDCATTGSLPLQVPLGVVVELFNHWPQFKINTQVNPKVPCTKKVGEMLLTMSAETTKAVEGSLDGNTT